jgi:hypothetical protein
MVQLLSASQPSSPQRRIRLANHHKHHSGSSLLKVQALLNKRNK